MKKLPWYIVVLIFVFCFPSIAFSEPKFVAMAGKAKVTLTDEKCALPEVVNLPFRGTWEEEGKVFEGCWGVNQVAVMTFWADKTAAALPREIFRKLTGV